MSKLVETCKTLTCLVALIFCFSGCKSQPGKGLRTSSRFMNLISDYTEIVVYSSRVPGYWARQVSDGEKTFLYTLDHSFKKGDALKVEGALGAEPAAVFDDDTGVYQYLPTNVFIVWKAALSSPGKGGHPSVQEIPGK